MQETLNPPPKSRRFPAQYWILLGVTFTSQLGFWTLYPFFSLYATEKFDAKISQVGIIFMVFSLAGLCGNIISGAGIDKVGRKPLLVIGLIVSGIGGFMMGFIDGLVVFYLGAAFIGLIASLGDPAQQSMIADIISPEKRTEGYGLWRSITQLSMVIGPVLGGKLSTRNFLLIFIAYGIFNLAAGLIALVLIRETKPRKLADANDQEMMVSFKDYRVVFQDRFFVSFLLAFILINTVYVQLETTLPVFLHDVHGITLEQFGGLLGLSAAIVILFQFFVSRQTARRSPTAMMAFGTLFYIIGFTMFGFISGYVNFALAIGIITVGGMIISPVSQAFSAHLAPEAMLGRYMAVLGFGWVIPYAAGPFLSGLVMDNFSPTLVWYLSSLGLQVALAGLVILHLLAGDRLQENSGADTEI